MKNKKKTGFLRFLRSDKGNAAIMVLSVILILTAFGTVSLFASLANVKMGNRYRFWSKDYYTADMSAEEKVEIIDGVLLNAADAAGDYMKEKAYNEDTVPFGYSFSSDISDDAQAFFHNTRWPYDSFDTYLAAGNTAWDAEEYTENMLEYNTQMYEYVYLYLANEKLKDLQQSLPDDDKWLNYESAEGYDD
jgi:hypothetical protein